MPSRHTHGMVAFPLHSCIEVVGGALGALMSCLRIHVQMSVHARENLCGTPRPEAHNNQHDPPLLLPESSSSNNYGKVSERPCGRACGGRACKRGGSLLITSSWCPQDASPAGQQRIMRRRGGSESDTTPRRPNQRFPTKSGAWRDRCCCCCIV